MKRGPFNNLDLDALLRRGRSYAEFAMRNMGRVPPTLLAETDEGLIVYHPETMGDERAKNNFANTARLVSIGYKASAAVLILESWISVARHGKPLDPSVPPSESPDREECVVIAGESPGAKKSQFLMIQRNADGAFAGFGTGDIPEFDQMQGRFADLMPPKPPTEEDRKMARQLLLMMGVAPDNLGFNPMWN